MAEVKRYEFEDVGHGYSAYPQMVARDYGDYVRYEDHTAIVAALERRARIAERALEMACANNPVTLTAKAEREIDSEQEEQNDGQV